MQRSAAEAVYEPHDRALASVSTIPSAALAHVVMSNCSAALTLSDSCRNKSSTSKYAEFVCVGSTSTRSCPGNPTILKWDRGVDGNLIDASHLGLERVVLSENPAIEFLRVNDNKLTKLALAMKMDELDAANNLFTSFDDITMPRGAVRLNVSHNTLQRITLSSAMTILTSLDATNTSLRELDAARATELLTLLASHNQLTNITNLAVPARLRFLDLAHNAITDWSGFVPPRALRVLNASDNGATQFIQGNWSELTSKLEVVNFSSNALTSIRGVTWPETLRELDLRGNPLEVLEIFDSDLPTFRQLATFLVPDRIASATNDFCAQRNGTAQRVAKGVTVCVVPSVSTEGGASPSRSPPALVPADPLDNTSSPSSSSSLLNVLIATFVGVGFAVLLVVGVMLRRRQNRAGTHHRGTNKLSKHNKTSTSQVLTSSAVTKALASLRVDDALVASLIHASDASEVRVIEDSGSTRTTLVRIGESVLVRKQVREPQHDCAVLALAREIRATAPLEHTKIVPFRGFTCTSARDLGLYTEYMTNGSLASLLKLHGANAQHHTQFPWVAASSGTSDAVRLDFAIDVAEALVYLHSFEPPVVHGNVRAKNVMLDATWRARLTGIGQRIEYDDFARVERGAVAWLAPEILKRSTQERRSENRTTTAPAKERNEAEEEVEPSDYSTASDVYAFGVFLAELDACCAQPFGQLIEGNAQRTNAQLASDIVRLELKPLFHGTFCPDRIRTLATSCLATAPEARPTAMKVYYELSQLRKQLRQATQNQPPQAKHISV